VCGKETKYNTFKNQYAIYCSNKCRIKDIDSVQDKKRETNLKKYGSTNVLVSKQVREQTKQKMLSIVHIVSLIFVIRKEIIYFSFRCISLAVDNHNEVSGIAIQLPLDTGDTIEQTELSR